MNQSLLIDAATASCRVGVADSKGVLSERTVTAGFKHAEQLTLLIQECMQEAACSYENLSYLAITGGPGSYTGLRIGASVAKGIAFAWAKPLIALNTLEVMAKGYQIAGHAHENHDTAVLIPMIDARRMEVFTAAYSTGLELLLSPQALVLSPDSFDFLPFRELHFFGDGALKYQTLFSGSARFDEDMNLSVEAMRQLAIRDFETNNFVDLAYYRPDYHKDFYSPTANK